MQGACHRSCQVSNYGNILVGSCSGGLGFYMYLLKVGNVLFVTKDQWNLYVNHGL